MNHWIIAPVILPAVLGPLIVLWGRFDMLLQRVFSGFAVGALLVLSVVLFVSTLDGQTQHYALGNWPAPFGIELVLDRLSALMLVIVAALGVLVLWHAIATGWDRKGWHFHSLFQFQLMGLNGAFLTADAFNLFVFFEILLIASYGLMIHAGGKARLAAGLQYVVMNLAGSTLFLFALGTIYATTGTLNMADLGARIAALPPGDAGLVRVGAVLLILVFALKAALVPLHFWLPDTYAGAPGPVAALFAVMTKVGAYSILRLSSIAFGAGPATDGLMEDLLWPAALVTLAIGAVGVLGARDLGRLAAWSAVASMGNLMAALALPGGAGVAPALYYMVHSTFAGAAMFLIADLVASRRSEGLGLHPAAAMAGGGLLGLMFMAAAVAAAGLPPLSGFTGKLMILEALTSRPEWPLAWAVMLGGSLLMVVGFARAGSVLFWKERDPKAAPAGGKTSADIPADPDALPAEAEEPRVQTSLPAPRALSLTAAPTVAALLLLAALSALAGPALTWAEGTAAQLTEDTRREAHQPVPRGMGAPLEIPTGHGEGGH
ncbi:monovalent cation/H+ antiporter subunit D [Phaeovulum vinaykumarii]|uniref:Multisubunit potassium/proton antiporter, PhaD subunit n=1 Tax=Phaeovulum vinaykumarii TaxID=407234 RepID=A0A1N7K149_9RHOB|nr:monovalent cation/H+ antiporter subunit D [Phaeovulum vinaykumarii]SIS55323.1 multisubunit potassium/proton antiporter, PhaD subunit [Phaeovulum vinaykumarii]SOB92325.1 multisubunit potassium/proton antiporter PhaD subunit [Phaeovulum vinaykumarii]